jgi:hypothetical protein
MLKQSLAQRGLPLKRMRCGHKRTEGDPNANPLFRRTVPEDRSLSPELLPDEVVQFVPKSQLKEEIKLLSGQVAGLNAHVKTQQVVMKRWKDQFDALFNLLKLVPKEVQVKAQKNTCWGHCEVEMLSEAVEEHNYSKKTYMDEVEDDGTDGNSDNEFPPGVTVTKLMDWNKQLTAETDGYKRHLEVQQFQEDLYG